ncbi:MAG: PilZ domain-containing protein [Lachnospira sp.]|nr:PilZ domain-containing protein [Lachnospira sp.]
MLDMLSIGDKIDIFEIFVNSDGEQKKAYYSQVMDKINSTQLVITMPTQGTKMIPLSMGKRYRCEFYTGNGLFRGDFIVIERGREGNIPVIILEVRTTLKKVQRREFFRLDCTLPMKYRIAEKDETIAREQLRDMQWQDGVVLDISGGGLRFVISGALENGSYIQCKLVLEVHGNYKEFYIYGRVIDCKNKPNSVRLHECRIKFYKLSEAESDQIVSFIFTEERKKRSSK